MTVPSRLRASRGEAVCPPAVGRVRVDELMSFAVLAEELHFTRAAERLFLTPGGLSRRVARLELALGERLLVRSSRRVDLTPAGHRIAAVVEPLVRLLSVFREPDDPVDDDGSQPQVTVARAAG